MDPSQRSYLVVSTSHDNSIKPDNRVFIIPGDFILIKSAGTLFRRCCALVRETMRFSDRKLHVQNYTLEFAARYRIGLKYWTIPRNAFSWYSSLSLSLIPVARKKISNVTLKFITCTLLIKIFSATFHSTTSQAC